LFACPELCPFELDKALATAEGINPRTQAFTFWTRTPLLELLNWCLQGIHQHFAVVQPLDLASGFYKPREFPAVVLH